MLNLIRGEFKKFRMGKYMMSSIIACLVLLGLNLLMMSTSYADGEVFVADYTEFFMMTDALVKLTYIVFASTIFSKLIIEEFNSKTINIMFMYPISRKKIMAAKLCIGLIFTVVSMAIAYIVISTVCFWCNSRWHVIPGVLTNDILLDGSMSCGFSIIITALASLGAFFVGLTKRSISAANVTAIIIGVVLCSVSSETTREALFMRSLIVGGIVLIIDIIGCKYIFKEIETGDL
ncbi:MAG: ABC transporter permease [Cellulosilyticum sp.]|nr:ABC transporter permease [Cellulosilyticum sp.]